MIDNRLPVYQIFRDAEIERRRQWVRRQQSPGWAWVLFIALEIAVVGVILTYY